MSSELKAGAIAEGRLLGPPGIGPHGLNFGGFACRGHTEIYPQSHLEGKPLACYNKPMAILRIALPIFRWEKSWGNGGDYFIPGGNNEKI